TLAQAAVAYHVGDTQVLNGDTVIVLRQRIRQLVQVVPALVSNVFMLTLNCQQLLASVLTAAFGAGKAALQDAQAFLSGAVVVRIFNSIAVAGGDECRYAH